MTAPLKSIEGTGGMAPSKAHALADANLAAAMGKIGRDARTAHRVLPLAPAAQKNRALERMAAAIRAQKPARSAAQPTLPTCALLADLVAETVGSWRFSIIQSVLLAIWIILNMIAFINHWDPYPFILLSLVLSFQAGYAAPIIMMSQNRRSIVYRQSAEHDYQVNVKSDLEIELLHERM